MIDAASKQLWKGPIARTWRSKTSLAAKGKAAGTGCQWRCWRLRACACYAGLLLGRRAPPAPERRRRAEPHDVGPCFPSPPEHDLPPRQSLGFGWMGWMSALVRHSGCWVAILGLFCLLAQGVVVLPWLHPSRFLTWHRNRTPARPDSVVCS